MRSKYRTSLPHLSGDLFLTDAGIETDLIFNHGIEIREFAAHTLLSEPHGREALAQYFRGFLHLARDSGTGFILDSQTWKAHLHWAENLGSTEEELRLANHESIAFIAGLRDEFRDNKKPIVLNAIMGPRGDAYTVDTELAAHQAQDYHAKQIAWLAETEADMITAMTFTHSEEAVGLVRAACDAGLPIAVSFTVETDGRLPSGQVLGEAIEFVDAATASGAAYFMLNCAHPDHFDRTLAEGRTPRKLGTC